MTIQMAGVVVVRALALILTVNAWGCFCSKPNIVFVLTDDQDVEIGGQIPVQKIKEIVGDKGIIFENMFVSSPLCCPSRSSILTGKYVHNHHAPQHSVEGNCSSLYWQQVQEVNAFPVHLKKQGYNTFFAGKYLNMYGSPNVGGVQHVPPGWDWWNGLVGNSRYYDYSLSVNGSEEDHGSDYKKDYLTDIIHRRAVQFLEEQRADTPFFMMLSTPACHAPFTPAPQYSNNFADVSAPRNGSFNKHAEDKHWLLEQTITPMMNDTIELIDTTFRNRWRTLLSVDDMVEDVVAVLQSMGFSDNTYVFFTSDNGYHLGQFSLSYDKRQLYEFDVRVPFMVKGPGIKPGQVRKEYVMNIDLAPTFVELSGGARVVGVDGESLVPVLQQADPAPLPGWRSSFLVEHSGEHLPTVPGCPQFLNQGMYNCDNHCVCDDSWNNTFTCVRVVSLDKDYKYCHLVDDVGFVEVYALHEDPYEFKNLRTSADPRLLQALKEELMRLSQCSGATCLDFNHQHWQALFKSL